MKLIVLIFLLAAGYCVNGYSIQPLRQQLLKKIAVFTVGSAFFAGGVGHVPSADAAAASASNNVKTYVNNRYHTKIVYPADFVDAVGNVDEDVTGRKVVAFIDPQNKDVSASLVFTAIPADYTRLTSFGTKDMLRDFVVPKAVDGLTTELISESTKGEMYVAEYTISYPELPTRHVISALALRPAESVVGLTVQSLEQDYSKMKDKLSVVLPSFTVDLP